MCKLTKKTRTHRKLLNHLFHTDFFYILEMDSNREADGINLRYRFGYDHRYADAMIASYLDNRPCSVLEMMVALALRVEENIMVDPEIGNHPEQWFDNMLTSLGLYNMTYDQFNPNKTDTIISRFLNRQYNRNGKGGLFTVNHTTDDLRDVEIWYQMCWYLNEVLYNTERGLI